MLYIVKIFGHGFVRGKERGIGGAYGSKLAEEVHEVLGLICIYLYISKVISLMIRLHW